MKYLPFLLLCIVRSITKEIRFWFEMSLLDKLRERFESADLSKYTDFKVILQYNIKQDGTVAAVFGKYKPGWR